jgi:thiol-disulfide isomerase/thioredoxin
MRLRSLLIFISGALLPVIISAGAPRPSHARGVARQEFCSQEPSRPPVVGTSAGESQEGYGYGPGRVSVTEADAARIKEMLKRDPKDARPLLINFWATWCEPCREEFPDLVRINGDYFSRGLEFITISLDDVAEIKTSVPQFLQEMHAPMRAYLLNPSDPDALVAAVDPTWGGALPATFLFDAQGQIAFKHMGRVKVEELRAALEKVLSRK